MRGLGLAAGAGHGRSHRSDGIPWRVDGAGGSRPGLIPLRWRWGWLAALLAAAAGAVTIWRIGPQQAAELVIASKALGGAEQRLEIWSRGLHMLQDFPFTGIGMGAFRQVANLLYPFFLIGPDAEIPHAHNIFLQVVSTWGCRP